MQSRSWVGEKHLSINVWRLRFESTFEQMFTFGAHPIDHHRQYLPDHGLVFLHRDFGLDSHELFQPFLLQRLGNLLRQLGRFGPYLLTVQKRTYAVEALITHKVDEFLKIAICFARETHNKGCTQRDIRYTVSDTP